MRFAVMMALLLSITTRAPAQYVTGKVGDVSSGEDLSGTLIVLIDSDSVIRGTTFTDSEGMFFLSAPANDSLRLAVQHLGYVPQRSGPLILRLSDTLQLVIGLRPDPIALEGVTVTAVANKHLERFQRRKRAGFGQFLDPEESAKLGHVPATRALASVPGGFLMPGGMGRIIAMARPSGRGAAGFCIPHVFVDGWALERGASIDSSVLAGSVRAVEVYRNPANAPSEYQRAFMDDCTVVLIWTDYGFGFGKYN